jgi:holo-[acyl-carrier protein] synthase
MAADKNFAVGNDLVHLPTFLLSLTDLFKKKAYTPAEIAYCDQFAESALRYASTWAAKEAVYKAVKQLDAKLSAGKK